MNKNVLSIIYKVFKNNICMVTINIRYQITALNHNKILVKNKICISVKKRSATLI